jgi:uncharacterized protein YbaR (Trm112 family)
MFIELTDHLRCPEDHDERYLVLLPDRLDGRSVKEGQLGCPVCGRTFAVRDGIVDFGGAPRGEDEPSALDPDALVALAGVSGPGGYFVLAGSPAGAWRAVSELLPGVALVAINPPAEVVDEAGISVLRGGRLPLKSRSMRGVVLGKGYAASEGWIRDAARVTLPGLRIVGEGVVPRPDLIELLASAEGVWVGTPRR